MEIPIPFWSGSLLTEMAHVPAHDIAQGCRFPDVKDRAAAVFTEILDVSACPNTEEMTGPTMA